MFGYNLPTVWVLVTCTVVVPIPCLAFQTQRKIFGRKRQLMGMKVSQYTNQSLLPNYRFMCGDQPQIQLILSREGVSPLWLMEQHVMWHFFLAPLLLAAFFWIIFQGSLQINLQISHRMFLVMILISHQTILVMIMVVVLLTKSRRQCQYLN